MAKVFVEGDQETFDRVASALRSAGLSAVEVVFSAAGPGVRRLPPAPANWAGFAALAPDLSYADWRDEVLSLAGTAEPAPLRPVPSRPQAVVSGLRRVG